MTTGDGRFRAKPIRSELFVPGNKEDWMRRAPRFNADAYILDLEDSVPPPEKAAARESVGRMVQELGAAGQTIVVRVNRLETGLTGDDLEAIVGPHLYCVLLPKVGGPRGRPVEVDVLLRHIERRKGLEIGRIFIDPALETASGIRQSWEIANASPRVAHMGASRRQGRRHRPLHRLPVDAGGHGDAVPPLQGAGGRSRRRHPLPHERRLDGHPRSGRPDESRLSRPSSWATPACT